MVNRRGHNNDDSSDNDDNEYENDAPKGLGDMLKKIAQVGMGAAFMTEESVRGVLNDLPVSKEIISGLVSNAKGAKEDFTKGLREEFSRYLSHLDKEGLIDYLVENYDIEVNASLSFNKKSNHKGDSKAKKTAKKPKGSNS